MTVLSHTHPLAAQLENDLLPLFRAALPQLSAAAPQVLASVFAFSSGSADAFQAYHLGISCLLDNVADDQPEEVALLVSAAGLDADLDAGVQLSAQVVWGQPSGAVEVQADLPPADVAALHAALPGLLAALGAAARRGTPRL